MAQLNLPFSINLTEIPKESIRKTDGNGQTYKNNAEYVNLRMFINDQADEFGNNLKIVLNQPKEENSKFIYIGSGKTELTDFPRNQFNFSINLTEIPKESIRKTDGNGQTYKNNAEYVNLRMFINDQADEFGNNLKIVLNQPKEENSKFIYIGSGKYNLTNKSN